MITQRTSILYAIFFFNDTATTEIYTLSLHDALPISSEPLLLEPEAELVEKPHRRDRRLPPALGQVVDERAQHTGLQLVVPRLGDDVVVEAVVPRHPEVGVVHIVGADAVDAVAVLLLEGVLGDVGRGRGEHVDVSALHEPGHERPEPRARQRRGVAQADEARA